MTDIFTSETTTEPTLDAFVGEGKKYSDNNAVAKALVEKDTFIARLLEEKRQIEADLREKANTQAFEDRMKALEAAQSTERTAPTVREVIAPQPVDIETTVQKIMSDREAANTRTRNLLDVREKLTQVYGDDFATRVKARASELNISLAKLNEMAAETPVAFYALIGLGTDVGRTVDQTVPPATRQNSAATPHNPNVKNNAYYQNLRKTNPTLYWTPKVQMEEYNELKRQGDAFGL